MRYLLACFSFLALSLSTAQTEGSFLLSSIDIQGNSRTKDWVILREITLTQGEVYSESILHIQLARSRDNIYNLGLFSDVRISPQYSDQEVSLLIILHERSPIQGTPVLDFRERNSFDVFNAIRERRFTRLVYGGELRLRNLAGRNETIKLTAQGGFFQKAEIEFFQPNFSKKRNLDLRIGLRMRRQHEIILGTEGGKVQWYGGDSLFIQRSIEAYGQFSRRLSLYGHLRLGLNIKRVRFHNHIYQASIGGETRRYLSNDEGEEIYPSLLLTYVFDKRNIKAFPLSGFKFQAFSRLSGGPKWATSQFMKTGITWAHHIPLNQRWNISYGIHEVFTLGDSVPYFDQSFIGIYQQEFSGLSHELRGYDPYAIAGTWIQMGKVELKLALIPYQIIRLPWRPFGKIIDSAIGVYLTGFCDVGYVQDHNFSNQDPFFKDRVLLGYGPGLNIIGFYDMLVRIEYARNHLGTAGVYVNATVPIK